MQSLLAITGDNGVYGFLQKSFEGHDCVIHRAETPDETLQVFLSKDIDVVFLDILIQDNGRKSFLDVLRQINIEPTIIVLVPASQPIYQEEARRIGAYELLETPLQKDALLHATKRALERQEMKRELGLIHSEMHHESQVKKGHGISESASDKRRKSDNLNFAYKEVFQKFSKVLTYVDDIDKLAEMTVEAISEIFRVGRIVFMMVDKDERICNPYRYIGVEESSARIICFNTCHDTVMWLSKHHQILNKDVLEREIVTSRLTRREALTIQKELNFLQAQLCIPIFIKGNLFSVIVLGNKITGKEFFDEDIELLTTLAGYISVAVENALLYRKVFTMKNHIENVLESIPCGIISIDSNNTVNTFNKSSAKMLKISPQDILGKDVKYIGSVFANILLRTLKDKKIYEMSQVEDRSTRSTYSISTSLLVNNGKELGSIMVFSDLSGMKKLESRIKVLEKQAFYKMLGKNMAHYMENHLVAVKTFMDLFPHKLETLYDAKEFIGKFFPVAQEELSNLDLLIKKLITLGENENLMKKSLDLKVPLDRALDVCKGEIKRLKIHIKKHYTEEPAIIFGNYEKLEEVFSTIIINAIEAMQESGTLTVKLSRVLLDGKKMKEALPFLNDEERSVAYCGQKAQKESPRDFLEVLIQDDGCGLPPGEVENIFLPFYTTKEHNIGLGLSIAQRLVEEFNGFISVSAIEKKGSSFYVLLPSLNVS